MRVLLGFAVWVIGAQASFACSPIELDACELTRPADAGLLAPFEAMCPSGLHIEEFAITPASAWVGLPEESWVLDPAQMSCGGAPICADGACAPLLSKREVGCTGGAECWMRQVWREALIPAP